MDYKLLIVIIAALLLLIAAVRSRLLLEIRGASLLVFGDSRTGIWLYSLLFLPGTVLHELSHWLMAEILQVPTGKLEIMPDLENIDGKESQLGYVMTGHTGPFKGFLIGFAPLMVGLVVLVILGSYLESIWGQAAFWHLALVMYGMIVVGNSMMVSSADRRNWPIIAILAVLMALLFWRLNLSIPLDLNLLFGPSLTRISQVLGLTIILNLGMILTAYSVRRMLEKITKKKLVMRR